MSRSDREEPTTPRVRHPDQPQRRVDGVWRFQSNPLVEELLREYPGGLNGLGSWSADRRDDADDHRQLAQLIGHSISGFSELSYVSDDDWARVDPDPTMDRSHPPAEDLVASRCPFCRSEDAGAEEVSPADRFQRPGQGYGGYAVTCSACGAQGPHVWDESPVNGLDRAVAAFLHGLKPRRDDLPLRPLQKRAEKTTDPGPTIVQESASYTVTVRTDGAIKTTGTIWVEPGDTISVEATLFGTALEFVDGGAQEAAYAAVGRAAVKARVLECEAIDLATLRAADDATKETNRLADAIIDREEEG